MNPYLIHIYIAAPGTPLKTYPYGTSTPGHMFYVIEHGIERRSFGLAPSIHGQINGPGRVDDSDERNYQKPLYQRTLEITQAQYDKLFAFGKTPGAFGFSTYYADVRNNCVDFTWKALEVAGLHATMRQGGGRGNPVKTVPRIHYEGSLKPTHNVRDVQTIQPPFPNSPHNRERRNAMPARDMKQWLLSETNQPASARRA